MNIKRILYFLVLLASVILEIFSNNLYSLLLLILTVVLPTVSVAFCFLSRKGLQIGFLSSESAVKGESTEVIINLKNSSHLPIVNVIADVEASNYLTGDVEMKKVNFSIGSSMEKSFKVRLENVSLGMTAISLSNVKIQDAFKLVSFKKKTTSETSLFVLPSTIPVEIQMPTAVETTGESIRFSENVSGMDPSEVFDIREYNAGDEVRSIHWKLSTKWDKPMVREFSKPLNYSIILLVELYKTDSNGIEACVEYATNISRGLLDTGSFHTMIWFDANTDELCSYNITDYLSLEEATLRLISSFCNDLGAETLNRFLLSNQIAEYANVIYLSTLVDEERLTVLSATNSIKTFYVSDDSTRHFENNELSIEKVSAKLGNNRVLKITL